MKKKVFIIFLCLTVAVCMSWGIWYLFSQQEKRAAASWFVDDVEATALECIADIEPDATNARVRKVEFQYDSNHEKADVTERKYPFSSAIVSVQTDEHRYTLYLVEEQNGKLILDRYEKTR